MYGEKKKKKLKGKWREDWVTVVMVVMLVSVFYFIFIFIFWDKRDFVLCAMMCELDTCTGLDVGLNGVAFFFSFIYLFIIIIF